VPESSRRSGGSLSDALAMARETLAHEPAGLLADFDGTLSPIVSEPSLARLVDGAGGALARLAGRLAVVAIITGRAPLEARELVGVPGLLIAGNHGMEWLEPGMTQPRSAVEADAVSRRIDEVLARLPDLPGVVPEHKGISASVHYRRAPDPEAARAAIVAALGDVEPSGLRLRHGRMIVEIRPVGLGDKGSAAREIIERFALRGVTVLGDDVTDLDMFAAVAALRDAGRVRGLIVGVGGSDRELTPEVAAAADVLLPDPASVANLLDGLASEG
jgi:trehalose 6-phosphate phosphatase